VQDFASNKEAMIKAPGFLILHDSWLTEHNKRLFCVETNKEYEVIAFEMIYLLLLKPEKERLPVQFLGEGMSNWFESKHSCVKVKDQDEIKAGYHLYEIR